MLFSGAVLFVSMLCLFINNRLILILEHTRKHLADKIKPELIAHDLTREGRFITTDQIPLLNKWYNEGLNYGLINLIGLMSSAIFFVYDGLLNKQTYIILVISVLVLVINVCFLPRAIIRHAKVVKLLCNYMLMVALLDTKQKLREHKDGVTRE